MHSQATMWFAKLKTRPISPTTLESFQKWQREPAHAVAYEAVERFWGKAATVADSPVVIAATEAAFQRRPNRVPAWRPTIAIPAAFALMLAVGGIGYLAHERGSEIYATRVGEQSSVRLADGSQVRLDTNTKLTVAFADGLRRVTLARGQASFAVAHDPAHPFTVEAGGDRVTAIGTRFNVRRDGNVTSVTLIEGRIRIEPGSGSPLVLTVGQRWSSDNVGAATATMRAADLSRATAWEGGRIVLNGRSLADAVADVDRYTPHRIIVDAPRYAQAQLSGSVVAGDTASFVAAATAMLPLRAVVGADESITLVERADSL